MESSDTKNLEEKVLELEQKLKDLEKLNLDMGNEIDELYDVIKGLEEERDELKLQVEKK